MRHPIPTSMFAAMNGNLTIPCRPEAAPTPVIRWLRNGAEIGQRQGMEVLYNGDLRITGVQQQDGGLYTCEATNANGQAQSHCTVTVIGGYTVCGVVMADRLTKKGPNVELSLLVDEESNFFLII